MVSCRPITLNFSLGDLASVGDLLLLLLLLLLLHLVETGQALLLCSMHGKLPAIMEEARTQVLLEKCRK